MTFSTADPCQGKLLPLESARKRILAAMTPIAASEWLPIRAAQGRILAEDLTAPWDLPAFTSSAMDGYALATQGLSPDVALKVIGCARAGSPFTGRIGAGECVRIFTGALVPEGVDAVIMQEEVQREGDHIRLQRLPEVGENLRPAGGDVKQGERILQRGHRLNPADLGLLAALGIATVKVFQCPRIAYFSTGDELRALGETLHPGQIYDSNRYGLHGLLTSLPIGTFDLGRLPDDLKALVTCLQTAGAEYDVILSTGGASVGEADLLRKALAEVGKIHLWRIAIKPGKPLIFGHVGRAWYFGLPGNPVSVHVTFTQIVRPALWRLAGGRPYRPLRLQVPCRNPLRKAPGRQEFQRGYLEMDDAGKLSVTGLEAQGSHQIAALSRANCYIVLPAECQGVAAGEIVEVEPFDAWLADD